MQRTFVFLVCFLILAASVGLYGQREQPQPQPVTTINEVRGEIRALRELSDERFKAMRELLDERKEQVGLALAGADKATQKAEEAQQRVNVSQNEFRGSLKDQAATLASKDSMDRLAERIANIEKVLASGEGRSGGLGSAQTLIFQVLPLLIALIALLWRRRPMPETKKES
jgi:hypothetical protein